MRKSIRRISRRKKSVSDKYTRKIRRTKKACNKSRNHKKTRKQMYVGGGCGASRGVMPKEVTDWWYQSDERNPQGYYRWTQMGPNESAQMDIEYNSWRMIHNPANARLYPGFSLTILPSTDQGETRGYKVHIYFPLMQMIEITTGLTKKIAVTTRYEHQTPVPPPRVNTEPVITPAGIPRLDAFGQSIVPPLQCAQGSTASSPLTSADTVTWYWQSDDGLKWMNYSPEDSIFLESAYQNKTQAPIFIRDWQFFFNTHPMLQMNYKTGSLRSIDRRVTPSTVHSTPGVLPNGWERRFDSVLNKDFFYNTHTKDISWTHPNP